MKKRTKYPFHPDFQKWANFNPPLNKASIFFIQGLMKLIYFGEKSDENVEVLKLKIPNGKEDIKALLYSPKDIEKNAPCLVYYHGGGFVIPGAPYHYNNCRKYALGARCKVLYVDYPLAPENQYPEPVYACYNAYLWLLENAERFSIDKTRVALGGDSAGGNLASVVAMMTHDKNDIKPCALMIVYPATSSGKETESMKKFTDTPLCNSKDFKKYCKLYFKSKKDLETRYVSPMKAEDFSIFPPTYVETAEFDCLRDDAILFAKELKKAGVETTLNQTKETIHGYDMVEDSSITKENLEKRMMFLKTYLEK